LKQRDKDYIQTRLSAVTFEEALSQASSFGIRPGLETMRALMAALGDPQERLPVVHVAGTNGKGSVCALLEAVFRAAGYKTGLYTSPHLATYGERFRLNGGNATEACLWELLGQVRTASDKVEAQLGWRPTEFELLTAMGFIYFAQAQVDILILEVGMGGRLDATNLLDRPLLTVITNVSMDHENFLGNEIKGIAGEKAGIIKQGVSLVSAAEDPQVQQTICTCFNLIQRDAAIVSTKLLAAKLHWVQEECHWQVLSQSLLLQQVRLQTPVHCYENLELPLIGAHQCINLATAIRGLELLQAEYPRLVPAALEAGISQVRWPGRLEMVSRQPLVILDGAHNPDGMKRLAQWLGGVRSAFERVLLVMGMLADKDRQNAAAQLEPLIDRLYITRPPSDRATQWEAMAAAFPKIKEAHITCIEDGAAALAAAMAAAGPHDLVLVTGSLYLVGMLRKEFPSMG